VEADVYVWRYALPVVLAGTEEEEVMVQVVVCSG